MFIIGLGTATPAQRYRQQDCWAALQASPQFPYLKPRSRAILRKVLANRNGIETRHLALDPLTDAFALSPDVLHRRFANHAPALGAQAAQRALEDAGKLPAEVDAVIVCTCTGYLCPGLSSYLSEALSLRPATMGLDLVGQGCGAALPALRTAAALLDSGAHRCVLMVAVEVCSAAFYLDDDPGVLISACLFGDGAAAAVLSNVPSNRGRAVRWHSTGSVLAPEDRELLRFEQRGGMLRNILSPRVPALAAKHASAVLEEVLAEAKLPREKITGWVLHAGGREVLDALRDKMRLTPADVRVSAEVLREYGNLSSPFVLFVLQAALAEEKPGGFWWMSSFGAGFSCHGALLEVE